MRSGEASLRAKSATDSAPSLAIDRRFWIAIAFLAGLLAAVQLLSIRQESQTWDEGFEIVGGYQYLTTGEYRPSIENPPLERILEAIPLLLVHPDLKGDALGANNTAASDVGAGLAFLYTNRIHAGALLLIARLPMIAVTIGLLLALAAWCKVRFGALAGLVAAVLFAADPTVIAHGRYVKNDMTVTAMAFLAVIAWDWFLRSGRLIALAASGVSLGLALGSKFSAVFLLPVFLLLYVLANWRKFSVLHFVKSFAAVSVLATAVLLLLYAPYAGTLLPHPRGAPGTPLRDAVNQSTMFGRDVAWIGSRLGWRAHPLLIGLSEFAAHGGGSHPAYLMGHRGSTGWWYYFPFAFAIKTPVGSIAAILLAIPFALFEPVLIVPIVIFGALSIIGHVDIGLRHILPVYPFLYALAGVGLSRMRWRFRPAVIVVVLAAAAIESLTAFPYYTAFFNALVGGSKNGPKYLVDSNIDWGQDLKRLGEFSTAHGNPRICIAYFGTAPTWYYVHAPENFPSPEEMQRGALLGCDFAAVSVTPLEGVYVPEDWFSWLRDVPLLERIGYSIYVWDVHNPAFVSAYAKIGGGQAGVR